MAAICSYLPYVVPRLLKGNKPPPPFGYSSLKKLPCTHIFSDMTTNDKTLFLQGNLSTKQGTPENKSY
mgnify:CR=1 FL=1